MVSLLLISMSLNSCSYEGPVTVSGPFFSICMATLAFAAFDALVQWCETVNYVRPSSREKHDGYIVCVFPSYERFSYWYDLYGKYSYLPFVHVRLVDDSVFVQVTCLGLLMSMTPRNKWHVSTHGKLGIAGM